MSKLKSVLAGLGHRALGVAVGAAMLASLAAASPVTREPALWVLRDADSTVYLFGTVHLLKSQTAWRSPKVERALAESQDVWFELAEAGDDAASEAAAAALLPRLGFDAARPLSSRLTAADRKRLAAATQGLGLPPAQLEPMRPWYAAVNLTLLPILKAGYDPSLGVDSLIAKAARAQNKSVRGLETMEQQFRFLADLPPELEVQMLREVLDDVERGPEVLDQLSAAWAAGDTRTFERLFVDELRDSPELYRVLIDQRNEAWAEAIKQRMDGAGVSFVAVGAGHLTGPDSVQAKLARRGIKAERR
jgi:uncharacterized protein YbaP (TraB family)